MTNDPRTHQDPPQHDSPGGTAGSGGQTLKTEKVQIERKVFTLSLRENPRGRFLKVTEDVGGRRDTLIIPSSGLEGVPLP